MIHEIGVELQVELVAKGCPLGVVDGPERKKTTTFGRERIVIEHDTAGDTIGVRHIADRNPRTFFTRTMGVKLTIFAQAPVAGAAEFEHRRRAEHVLDLVIVALNRIASKRHNGWSPKSGRFIDPDDFVKAETMGGAVYELTFTFDRGVADRTWAGAAQPQVTVGTDVTIANTTKVAPAGDPADTQTSVPADAETV